ncbi:MAG TPA: class II aldolase/adducin family protein [Candidatus Scatomorpha stercoravium]|nr:class II aldolase/adducin family protein [Candidatus Scatomorpha stercoravium]
MLMRAEREALVDYGKKLSLAGLCPGTSGNLSVYDPDSGLMAITPSGLNYFETCPEDIVITDLSGNIADGGRRPSSELNLHAAFYRAKPEARSVVHTHSVFCTTLGILGEPIRAVHFMIGAANSREIPLAPYVTFGTQELAETAVRFCGGSKAVLLANHGLVTCGGSLADAFELAVTLEYVAQLQYRARCAGSPNVLDDEQVDAAIERFRSYGQK